MSDTVKLWCFLLLLPFFLVVGHDLYANYYADEGKRTRLEAFDIDPTAYQSSDLGYLVVKYLPGVYENLKSAVGEENWIKWADPVLRLYSFVVALIPALLFFYLAFDFAYFRHMAVRRQRIGVEAVRPRCLWPQDRHHANRPVQIQAPLARQFRHKLFQQSEIVLG